MPNLAPVTHRPARHTRRLAADDAIKHLPLPSTATHPLQQGGRAPRRPRQRPPSPVHARGTPTPWRKP
jgi:hypothetical protein